VNRKASTVGQPAIKSSTSIPVFITNRQVQDLLDLNFPKEVIYKMTPEEVIAAIKKGKLYNPERDIPQAVKEAAEKIAQKAADEARINTATTMAAQEIIKDIEKTAEKENKARFIEIKESDAPTIIIGRQKMSELIGRMLTVSSGLKSLTPEETEYLNESLRSVENPSMTLTREASPRLVSLASKLQTSTSTTPVVRVSDNTYTSKPTTTQTTSAATTSTTVTKATATETTGMSASPTSTPTSASITGMTRTGTATTTETMPSTQSPTVKRGTSLITPITAASKTFRVGVDEARHKAGDKKAGELPPVPVTWRQGLFWITINPPYNKRSDIIYTRQPPAGAYEVKGFDSAYKTIQSLGGDANLAKLTVDMGTHDVEIYYPSSNPGRPGAIRFKRDKHLRNTGDITIGGGKKMKKNKKVNTEADTNMGGAFAPITVPATVPVEQPAPVVINEDKLRTIQKVIQTQGNKTPSARPISTTPGIVVSGGRKRRGRVKRIICRSISGDGFK